MCCDKAVFGGRELCSEAADLIVFRIPRASPADTLLTGSAMPRPAVLAVLPPLFPISNFSFSVSSVSATSTRMLVLQVLQCVELNQHGPKLFREGITLGLRLLGRHHVRCHQLIPFHFIHRHHTAHQIVPEHARVTVVAPRAGEYAVFTVKRLTNLLLPHASVSSGPGPRRQ